MTRSGVFVRLVVLLTALGPAAMDVSAADGEATILNLPGHVTTDGIGLASRGQHVVVAWQATVMTADAEGGSQLFIARSHDGGATFEAPQRINRGAGFSAGGGEQAPRPLFVSDQELLVVWRASRDKQDVVQVSRSTDGGESFARAVPLHDPALSGYQGFHSAAVAPDGALHVTWLDGRNADGLKRSPHSAPRQDVYHASWRAGDAPVETPLEQDVCFCCKTATAISSDGSVLAAWRHIYPGHLRDFAFARATAGRFDQAIRVSEDGWELQGCPDDGAAMAVDGSGGVHLVWPTVIQEPKAEKRIFYGYSADGGNFAARVALPHLGGDTMSHPQITIVGDRLVVVWDENLDGRRQVAFAYGRVDDAGAPAFQPATALTADGRAAYPVAAPVGDDVIVAWTQTSGERTDTVIALRRLRLGD